MPVAIETRCVSDEEEYDFMLDLGQRIATAAGERRATEFMLQRLSVAIQRGTASWVLGELADGLSELG